MFKIISGCINFLPPYVLVVIACAIWALNIILLYPYTLEIPSEEFNLLQYLLGTLLIVFWMYIRRIRIEIPRTSKHIGGVVFLGVVGSAIAGICFVSGIQKIAPSSFSFVQILQPFWVFMIAIFLLKKKLAASSISILIWMVLNFALIAWPDLHLGILFSDLSHYPFHVLMASISMVIWGTCTLVGKYLLNQFSIESVIFWRWILSFFAALIICLLKGASFNGFFTLVDEHFFRFFIVGGLLDIIAMSLYYVGLKKMKAVNVAVLELSYPAFGIIFSSIHSYSLIEPVQILGVGALLLFMFTLASNKILAGDGNDFDLT